MAKKQSCDCPKCMPEWLAAFGDLMSLLLCFFVLLLSMSTMDAKKLQEAIGSLAGALSVLEGGTKTEVSREMQQIATPIEQQEETSQKLRTLNRTIIEVNEMIKTSGGPEAVLEEGENGFMIRLPAKLLFKKGSAKIENDDAILFLKRISLIIAKLPNNLVLNVIGHTDDQAPAKNGQFKDNWELSSARAISVVKELIKDGVNPKRMTACGKAQYDPIATNETQIGREKNRRVELQFFSKKKKDKNRVQKSVLDTISNSKAQSESS